MVSKDKHPPTKIKSDSIFWQFWRIFWQFWAKSWHFSIFGIFQFGGFFTPKCAFRGKITFGKEMAH
jgi:hypothetical protein